MHYLQRSRCPDITVPVLLQCANDVERELPQKFRADFRNGQRVLTQKFANEIPAMMDHRFAEKLNLNIGDTALACQSLAAENGQRRMQLMRQLKSFSNSR